MIFHFSHLGRFFKILNFVKFNKNKLTSWDAYKIFFDSLFFSPFSVDELTTSANSKQAERIELLMKSLDNRGTDIIDLEKK